MYCTAVQQGVRAEIEEYARHVSHGYRPPLVAKVFRGELGALISDCWAQNPVDRPTMAWVRGLVCGGRGVSIGEDLRSVA